MKEQAQRVQQHFHRTAADFDSIYTGDKSAWGRFLDKLLRWDIQERMNLSLQACQPLQGRTVLDVGCGTGRFCFPLALGGAERVVGIDFAAAMIERANALAAEMNLAPKCTFICDDFAAHEFAESFDYVLAIGLFDYIPDARHLLVKLRQLTRGKLVMTFPRADTWRAPLRKIRLGLLGCPVYFYSEKRLRDYLLISGFTVISLVRVGKLFFVVAE